MEAAWGLSRGYGRENGSDVSINVRTTRPLVGGLRYDRKLKLGDEIKRNIIEWRIALMIGDGRTGKCAKAQRDLAAFLIKWLRGIRHAHQDAAKFARLISG